MRRHYRVEMRPLEPYTFGTEQGSKFEGATDTGKESYIIASGAIPEQTTVLGTLRYIILKHKGLLRHDFRYTEEEKVQMKKWIGEKSFSFYADSKQDFGAVKKISPLFLVNRCSGTKAEIYIKNPFHNKSCVGYEPMELTEETFVTSFGSIHLPLVMKQTKIRPEYDAKNGHGGGYIRLSDKSPAPADLFSRYLQTGNRADHADQDNREGFFKRETVSLKKDFAFSVFVEAEEGCFPLETIAYMGRKKSAFQFRFIQMDASDCDLRTQVEKAFSHEKGCWYYALSDLYLNEIPVHKHFAIVEEKSIRNIETRIDKTEFVKKRRKSNRQFHLIESGSVFFGYMDLKLKNENLENIGYNAVVRLGGK